MAYRRVNTRFLTIMALVVVGIASIAILIGKVGIRPRSAKPLIDQADAREQNGDLKAAIDLYTQAINIEKQNVPLRIKFGDLLREYSRQEPGAAAQAVSEWEAALEYEPNNQGALQRLMDAYLEAIQLQQFVPGYQRYYGLLKSRARKVLDKQPANNRARALIMVADVAGFVDPRAAAGASEEKIEEIITQLRQLMPKAPDVVEIPYYISAAYVKMGRDKEQSNLSAAAAERFDKATQIFDEALVYAPKNALLKYRYYQVLRAVSTRDGVIDPDRMAQLNKLLKEAAEGIKPEDQFYVETKVTYANFIWQQGKREEALKYIEELAKEQSESQLLRNVQGAMLRADQKTRVEADRVLSQPAVRDPSLVGFRGYMRGVLEFQRLNELVETRIERYVDEREAEDSRAFLRARIDEAYTAAARMRGEDDPLILKLRARKLMLSAQTQDVIQGLQLLQKAYDRIKQQRGGFDQEITLLLARGYKLIREYGQALLLSRELVERVPALIEGRKLYAELLLLERQSDEARKQIKLLEDKGVNDEEVVRLKIASLNPSEQSQAIDLIAKLPETNDIARFNKARMAMSANDDATAIRLLEYLRLKEYKKPKDANDPNREVNFSVPATRLLLQLHLRAKRQREAERTIESSLAKDPENKALKILQAAVNKESPEELRKLMQGLIDELADGVEKELRAYELSAPSNMRDALQHLQNAESMAPEDGRVLTQFFNYCLSVQNYRDAALYQEKLARIDYDHMGGLSYRFRLQMLQNNQSEALKTATEMTKRMPEFARSWLALAQAQQLGGRYVDAKENFKRAKEKGGNSLEALRGLIGCSYQLNDPVGAKSFIDEGLKYFPNNADLREIATNHEEEFGNPEKVIEDRTNALKKNDSNLDTWIALARTYTRAGVKRKRTGVPGWEGYLDKGRTVLIDAVKKNGAWADNDMVYRLRAEIAIHSNRYDDGVVAFQELAARPAWQERPEPQIFLGQYYVMAGKYDLAEEQYKKAVEKTPKNTAVRIALIQFYEQTAPAVKDQLDKAIKVLLELAETNNDPAITKEAIDLQIKTRKYEAADSLLRTQLLKRPNDADLIGLQGLLCMETNRSSEAEAQFSAAIKIDPTARRLRYFRGLIRLNAGQYDLALEDLRAARDQTPNQLDIYLAIADALRARGEIDEAVQQLETALRLNPNSAPPRIQLVNILATRDRARAEQLLNEAETSPALKDDPTWVKIHGDLLANENPEAALKKIEAAYQLAPNNGPLAFQYIDMLIKAKSYPKANEVLEKIGGGGKLDKDWRFHMYRALYLNGVNDRNGAFVEFDAALANSPHDSVATKIVGELCNSMGVSSAIAHVSEPAKTDLRWRVWLAVLYREAGQLDEAMKAIESVLAPKDLDQLPPDRKELAFRIAGLIYLSGGAKDPAAYERAVVVYVRYLEFLKQKGPQAEPDAMLFTYNNLAWLLAENVVPPRPQQAREYSQAAYNLMKASKRRLPQICDTHGWILVQLNDKKDLDTAIDVLGEAVQAAPDLPEAAYHLGNAYLRKNQLEMATLQLQRAARILHDLQKDKLPVDEKLLTAVNNDLERAIQMAKNRDAKGKGGPTKTP